MLHLIYAIIYCNIESHLFGLAAGPLVTEGLVQHMSEFCGELLKFNFQVVGSYYNATDIPPPLRLDCL